MKGKSIFTKEEAEQIILLIEQKLKSDSVKQKGIRQKIRNLGFYARESGIGNGYTVADFLSVVTIEESLSSNKTFDKSTLKANKAQRVTKRGNSDEAYILDICDEVLGLKGLRQYRFDFLR